MNLQQLTPPSTREHLRDVLIRDQGDRDAIAQELLRFGDANGVGWAEVVDLFTMHPPLRRRAVQILAEVDAR